MVVVQSPGSVAAPPLTIDWNDKGDVRVESKLAPGYVLEKDGTVYSVSKQGDHWLVVDIVKLNAARRKAGVNMGTPLYKTVKSVEPLGRSETVAGIEGKLYSVTWSESGKTTTEEWVLTDDPRIVAMTRLFAYAMAAAYDYDGTARAHAREFFASLPEDARGILRSGATGQVASFLPGDPEASVFDLPAPPADVDELMREN